MICPRLILVDHAKLVFDGELRNLRATLGSSRRLMLEFASDPGTLSLASATLTADEGLVKHYLIQREDVSLVDVLAEVGRERVLKDIAIEEPSIEEVIRTFYARQSAGVHG
jgi:ABC-2 type transport system ATP-binding protein